MSQMISVASGFQYSVNIGFDLHNDDKLKNFIPTKSALSLLKEILLSTKTTSTDRARVLIGAYGKGKSHIVLTILSLLMKRDLTLFEKMMPRIREDAELMQCVQTYYESDNCILPVVITGNNTSLTQSFILALQRTLSDNNLMDVMPETNYRAALAVIKRWKADFPDTYREFCKKIGTPIRVYTESLLNYDAAAYEQFERIYPTLTAGSEFNPFLGFDVVELYESVAKGLSAKGYSGLYIVYDEFSKYLEANITQASVSDTKMLQDLAEKCNRSGQLQMHLMLISHKEISNYIDKLPQQKVDGWRGVSERFKHIHLNNNFTQTYEIISNVIQKSERTWTTFCRRHADEFGALEQRYSKHSIFSGVGEDLNTAIFGCYPLHPVSTFILPRLSERVAQNERTLFTFLSTEGNSTLPSFLTEYGNKEFKLITPDIIYDYFEPLFKKESYASEIHVQYLLTASILARIEGNELGCKIVKTISLIYMLEQFEKLCPTKEEIRGIFASDYRVEEIERVIDGLIADDFVIYLRRSNSFLRLKQTSGVDIHQKIHDLVESQAGRISVKDTLNSSNFDNYMYPSRYNDEREMTRFFSFEFINEDEVASDTDWNIKSEKINADGVIYGILPQSQESLAAINERLCISSRTCNRCVFVIPKHYQEIERLVYEYSAVTALRNQAVDDPILFDEYEVIYEDLREVINTFMMTYTHPEQCGAAYIHDGNVKDIRRKASLTELMSEICEEVYRYTPVISNEAVNKDEITAMSSNSRGKIITGLLRNVLEPNLGLSGTGQEVSIMRSTLVRTHIWQEDDVSPSLNLNPKDPNMRRMLQEIVNFIKDSKQSGSIAFSELYKRLTGPERHIGLRRGLIPIYLAAVLHEYKQQIAVRDRFGQVPLNADTFLQINVNPEAFSLIFLDWNPEKEQYTDDLSVLFAEYVNQAERSINSYDYVANAMRRWFMALPKYSKECHTKPSGEKLNNKAIGMMRLLRQNLSSYELLFIRLPETFGHNNHAVEGLIQQISDAKSLYDNLLSELKSTLIAETKRVFMRPHDKRTMKRMSLASTITDWCDSLSPQAFEQLFADGTDKCLKLFRTITNDENAFICRLAKLATDLRVEDWDDDTVRRFSEQILLYKETATAFIGDDVADSGDSTSKYQISFIDEKGKVVTKRFDHVEYSKRGKLLFNQITSSLEAMGHAISEQEKRQILVEVLKNLC